MAMTEEELLKFTATCFEQMKEMVPDEENLGECRKLYHKYMKAYDKLLAIDFDKYADMAADAYYTLTDIYYALVNMTLSDEKAETANILKLFTKMLKIHKKQAEKDPKYLQSIADDYNAMGEAYEGIGKDKKAEKMYDKADEIFNR